MTTELRDKLQEKLSRVTIKKNDYQSLLTDYVDENEIPPNNGFN